MLSPSRKNFSFVVYSVFLLEHCLSYNLLSFKVFWAIIRKFELFEIISEHKNLWMKVKFENKF